MHDDMSPEEKLLRLIKGSGKPDTGDKPPENTDQDKKKQLSDQDAGKEINGNNTSSDNEPARENIPEPTPPAPEQQDQTVHKDTHKPVKPVLTFDQTTPDKSKPEVPKQEPVTVQTSSKPIEPTPEQPVSAPEKPVSDKPSKKDPDKSKRKNKLLFLANLTGIIIHGFNAFNFFMLICLFAIIAFTVWNLKMRPADKILIPEIETPADNDGKTPQVQPEPKPFPYFAEELTKKNLFRLVAPPPPPPPKGEKKEPEKPKIKIESLTQNLVLQGIVFDIGPPQAIIYDKKENKTLFVGNGTMINEVKVKEIKRSKVILEYEDQKQELTF